MKGIREKVPPLHRVHTSIIYEKYEYSQKGWHQAVAGFNVRNASVRKLMSLCVCFQFSQSGVLWMR